MQSRPMEMFRVFYRFLFCVESHKVFARNDKMCRQSDWKSGGAEYKKERKICKSFKFIFVWADISLGSLVFFNLISKAKRDGYK